MIIREPGSGTRAALEHLLRLHGVEPRTAMETASNETIEQAVMADMGVSSLSLHTIGLELRSHLIAVPDVVDMPVVRRWHVVNTSSTRCRSASRPRRRPSAASCPNKGSAFS